MLSPAFNVITPATDLTLLSLAEMRAAVGLTNNDRDSAVKRVGSRVVAAITNACKIATDGATPPTLRQETVQDTFRLNRWWNRRDHPGLKETLILSRRPIVQINSVVEAGNTLDPTADFEVRAGAGFLNRLFMDSPSHWARDKIVINYDAGWATVPDGLKRAAEELMVFYWSEGYKDPLLRSVTVSGVLEREYWIGSPTDPAIPQSVMDKLGPYINPQA
jgi:hypothetical protein